MLWRTANLDYVRCWRGAKIVLLHFCSANMRLNSTEQTSQVCATSIRDTHRVQLQRHAPMLARLVKNQMQPAGNSGAPCVERTLCSKQLKSCTVAGGNSGAEEEHPATKSLPLSGSPKRCLQGHLALFDVNFPCQGCTIRHGKTGPREKRVRVK